MGRRYARGFVVETIKVLTQHLLSLQFEHGQAMDEIIFYIRTNDKGHGLSEARITKFASNKIPLHSVLRVIEIMERSGQIYCHGTDRTTKLRYFRATSPDALS